MKRKSVKLVVLLCITGSLVIIYRALNYDFPTVDTGAPHFASEDYDAGMLLVLRKFGLYLALWLCICALIYVLLKKKPADTK